jgi:hypothetical protein
MAVLIKNADVCSPHRNKVHNAFVRRPCVGALVHDLTKMPNDPNASPDVITKPSVSTGGAVSPMCHGALSPMCHMGATRKPRQAGVDALGCLRSLRARSALDGVSWVQGG